MCREDEETNSVVNLNQVSDENINNNNDPPETPVTAASSACFFNDLFEDETPDTEENVKLALANERHQAIVAEVNNFAKWLSEVENIKSNDSSNKFWSDHSSEYPYLSDIYRIILLINSSSASIERFFSICGIIQIKEIKI